MTLSNRDAILMKTGNSTIERLDPYSPQIRVLSGGQIDAPGLGFINQDGDTCFENFFALKTDKNGFNAAGAMKFSMEHQNPLVAGTIKGKAGPSDKSFSLFEVSNPDVLVWALKPSEEGIGKGIIMRVWNMSDTDEEVVISSSSEIARCNFTTHIETNISEIKPESGVLKLRIGHNRLETYRIFLK
jgi:alpha-mannosidase